MMLSPFLDWLRNWWRSTRARLWTPPTAASPAALAEVRADLDRLNHATEEDFLRVGARLQAFLEQAKEISRRCSDLAGLLSAEEADRADRDLRSILERTEGLIALTGLQALDQMLAGVGGITAPLRYLQNDMRTFRVLAILIRIESARLENGAVDFETLADEVRKLAVDIEQNSETVHSGARRLGEIVRAAIPSVAGFEARQKQELPRIRSQAVESLRMLNLRRQRAASVTARMAAGYDAVWRDIGCLVTSLQFHDITRQQIEHVAVSLEQAGRCAASDSLAGHICRLQCAQLEQSRTAFQSAVGQVRDNLGAMARHVSGMAEEVGGLLGSADGCERSLLGEMEHGFAGIRAALDEYAESRYALSTVAETVASGVEEMTGFIDMIDEISVRMQRVALNANIKAIQIGENGLALGAVADGIQRLAADSSGQTDAVGRGIRAVRDRSGSFCAEMQDPTQNFSAEMERIIAVFRAADTQSGCLLPEIDELGRALARELEEVRGGIQADAQLTEAVDRSLGRLAEFAERAGSEPLPQDQQELLEMEQRYTMAAERAVHRQAALGDPESPVVDAGGELGDNVELF